MEHLFPNPRQSWRRTSRTRLLAMWLAAFAALAIPGTAGGLLLRFSSGATPLALDPVPQSGAVFVFAAPDLHSLQSEPEILFQTNTPLPDGLRLPPPANASFARQGFFKAAFWPGVAPALVEIPAGNFVMGAPESEAEVSIWEGPQTVVTIAAPFKMGKYEVTQTEYQALMGGNPSYYTGIGSRPVEEVSWAEAMDYCARLTASQQAAGALPPDWIYRLPTEAEWEYACRAGTTTAFAHGPALRSGAANFAGSQEFDASVGTIMNPAGVTVGKPATVGSYAPNPWGLHDMHGNVWEWCLDRWSEHLPGGSVTDPQGPTNGPDRLVRGGCYYNIGRICRSSYRARGNPVYRGNETGFRVVLARRRVGVASNQ